MKKSRCKKCDRVEPHKRILQEKGKQGLWTIIIFDMQCRKCKTVTWNHVEATAPNASGGKYLLMAATNVAEWFDRSLLDIFKDIVGQNETKAQI